jgi:KUP system potassium uptake protein
LGFLVQLAFCVLVYPSLLITYTGQAAYLIKNPGDIGAAFYKSIPQAVYWPMFVVSTLAAIVASQALITATFSIIKQSMALSCFPRVKIVHTSKNYEGQIYSPEVNYVLMIICLAIVVGFRDGTQIGNAYGKNIQIYI